METEAPAAGKGEALLKTDTPIAPERIDDPDLRSEVASLLELTKHKINKESLTPCPACNVLVHVKLNKCPHCDSFIAPNNALMRESMRRLLEIQAELDREHLDRVEKIQKQSGKKTLGERIKYLFSSPRPPDGKTPEGPDPTGPRILDRTFEGGQLKVLECDGPWCKVSTRDGRTGWVYSTLTSAG
jgi:hypothetical protein